MIVNYDRQTFIVQATGNTKGRSITVLLPSCLTGLESVELQLTMFCFYWWNRLIKPVKQEVNRTGILPPLAFPGRTLPIYGTSTEAWKPPCCISLILCKNDFLMLANQNAFKRNFNSLKCLWNLPQESISWTFCCMQFTAVIK